MSVRGLTLSSLIHVWNTVGFYSSLPNFIIISRAHVLSQGKGLSVNQNAHQRRVRQRRIGLMLLTDDSIRAECGRRREFI